jgi:hypothetical protein
MARFAALNVKTSELITQFHQRHRSSEFRQFPLFPPRRKAEPFDQKRAKHLHYLQRSRSRAARIRDSFNIESLPVYPIRTANHTAVRQRYERIRIAVSVCNQIAKRHIARNEAPAGRDAHRCDAGAVVIALD